MRDSLAPCLADAQETSDVGIDAAASSEIALCDESDQLTMRVLRRLRVPCAPTELAGLLNRPVRTIRATLCNLKKAGRVKRLDRAIKSGGKRGPRLEHLWARV